MKKKINKKILLEILAVFLLGLVPLLWFKPGFLIAGSDISYPFDPISFFLRRFYVWNNISNTGSSAGWNAPSIFFHGVQAFFSFLGFSLIGVQKLSRVFWFSSICFSMYFFSSVVTDKHTGSLQRLSMVLFYAFSPFLFNAWEGNAGIICASAATPFMLGMLICGLERKIPPFKAIALMSLVSVIFCEIGVAPSIFLIPVIVCVFYFFFYVISQFVSRRNYRDIKFSFIFFALFWLSYLTINTFWWLPYGYEILSKLKLGLDNPLAAFNMINWLDDISIHTSLLNVSRFQGAWDWYYSWNDVPYVAYAKNFFANPLLLTLGALVPILAYSALLLRKKDGKVLFFTCLALIATFFSAGTHPPTGMVFSWIVKHIKILLLFRSPYYKFGLIMVFAYAYLMSVSVCEIYKRVKYSKNLKKGRFGIRFLNRNLKQNLPKIIIAVIMCGFLIYNYPMLTGDIIPLRTKVTSLHVKIPDYVFRAANWLTQDKEFIRVISLPRSNTDNYKWGYGAATNIMYLFARTSIVWQGAFSGSNELRDIFYQNFYAGNFFNLPKILRLLSVKYVWLAGDSWHKLIYGEDDPGSEILREKLFLQKGLNFEKKIGWWEFFEIENTLDHIFASNKGILVDADNKALLPLMMDIKDFNRPVIIFSGLNPSNIINNLMASNQIDTLVSYNNSIAEKSIYVSCVKNSNIYFKNLLSSQEMQRVLIDEPEDNIAIKIRELRGLSAPEKLIDDQERRFLLISNMSPNLIIENSTSVALETNLAMEVYSCEQERRFYIYLNKELIRHLMIDADKPTEIMVEKIRLKPGINHIAFYTPYQYSKIGGRVFSFALRDIKIGSFNFKTDVFLPKKGKYKIYLYPYPQTKMFIKQIGFDKTKIIHINNKPIVLNLQDLCYEKKDIYLEEGRHSLKLNQQEAEEYYVCFELKGENVDISKSPIISFKEINPTKYEIRAESFSPYYLVFNESFHPDWKLYIDGREAGIHFLANGYANGWLIKKKGKHKIILEFWPQRLFAVGSTISLTVFILFLLGLVIRRVKKWNI